jgi:membrane associated rhomboid family serine protease
LWFIGGAVEQSHGFASATVLFIIPAVGGNILSAICLPQYISVGASGGIFGLIGGCLADITLNWNLLFLKTTADEKSRMRHAMVLLWLGFDIMVNCLLGLTPFVGKYENFKRLSSTPSLDGDAREYVVVLSLIFGCPLLCLLIFPLVLQIIFAIWVVYCTVSPVVYLPLNG